MRASRSVWSLVVVFALAAAGPVAAQTLDAQAGGLPVLAGRVAALEAQLAALSPLLELIQGGQLEVVTNESGVTVLRLTGINLQVRNGLGASSSPSTNGAGNVIIGYDEVRTTGPKTCSSGRYHDEATCVAEGYVWAISYKNGSHYLVVGSENNYGRASGIVVGQRNSSSAPFSSVLAGRDNSAARQGASVSGGMGNLASGPYSAVSGGISNTANEDIPGSQGASVSGGYLNVASGWASSVSGGRENVASGTNGSVSAGYQNEASGPGASVCGGANGVASGWSSAVSGGYWNAATADVATVSGGFGLTADSFAAHVP